MPARACEKQRAQRASVEAQPPSPHHVPVETSWAGHNAAVHAPVFEEQVDRRWLRSGPNVKLADVGCWHARFSRKPLVCEMDTSEVGYCCSARAERAAMPSWCQSLTLTRRGTLQRTRAGRARTSGHVLSLVGCIARSGVQHGARAFQSADCLPGDVGQPRARSRTYACQRSPAAL